MIGVICRNDEHPAVREFFELFKTPWAFWEAGKHYDAVLVSDSCSLDQIDAELVVVFGGEETPLDASLGIAVARPVRDAWLETSGSRLPIYQGAAGLDGGESTEGRDVATAQPLIAASWTTRPRVVRCGYSLFDEIAFLLSAGQPPANAETPTVDLHIALLRSWLVRAQLSVWEIRPSPPGFSFFGCLTHDVDFLGIRRHRFDATLAGFLLRASIGSVIGLARGTRSLRQLLRNWGALISLPLVYLRLTGDPWDPFERYMKAEGRLKSTFFLAPFRGRPGHGPAGPADRRRALPYDVEDVRGSLPGVRSKGVELGVHGIDAWHDVESATDEFRAVANVVEDALPAVRMHWLYFDESSFSVLDEAGFEFDSTSGYNETVGYRAGTTQVFQPLSCKRLLELPLHIQDTALFFPTRMHYTERQAARACDGLLDWAQEAGGVITLSWHERSLAPERLWDRPYERLLTELQSRKALVTSAGEVVEWFRRRRGLNLEQTPVNGATLAEMAGEGAIGDRDLGVVVRIHTPHAEERSRGFVDVALTHRRLKDCLNAARLNTA